MKTEAEIRRMMKEATKSHKTMLAWAIDEIKGSEDLGRGAKYLIAVAFYKGRRDALREVLKK